MANVSFRDRIVDLVRVKASELVANEHNFRRHPERQRAALLGALGEIGYAGAIIARRGADGRLVVIDGHLRQEISQDEPVPVLVTDLTEDEADKLLVTYDAIGAGAEDDAVALTALLDRVAIGDADLRDYMEDTARAARQVAGAAAEMSSGTRPRIQLNRSISIVKVAMAVDDIATLEAAIAKTGKVNRAEAFLEVCRSYLETR